MKIVRKITISFMRRRSLVVRSGLLTMTRCPNGSLMVTATSAAALSNQSLRTICRWVEAEQVHYSEGPEGLFICLSSMPYT